MLGMWTTKDSPNPDVASEAMIECPDFFCEFPGENSGSDDHGSVHAF